MVEEQASRLCQARGGTGDCWNISRSAQGELLQTAALLAGGDVLLHPVFPQGRFSRREGGMDVELLARAVVSVVG